MSRRKLKLNVADLSVDSLELPRMPRSTGTVRANLFFESEINDTVYRPTDPSDWNDTVARDTQWVSCGGTCGTCGGTDCWA